MSTALLHTEDLTKVYQISAGIFKGKKSLTAANGISIDVNQGEVVGLVGESGCGKSTVAKIILGLEKATTGSFSTAIRESAVGTPGTESLVSMVTSLKGRISPATFTPPAAFTLPEHR